MKGRKMTRASSKASFRRGAKTHRFNVNGHVERGGIRL